MNYRTASAFRDAIDARLKRYAAEHGQTALARARKHIAFERFLARLFAAAPDQWTLKGGVALDYRLGDKARATRDLDLLHDPDLAQLDEDLAMAESIDLGDFFIFSIRRTDKLDGLIDGAAVRYHVQADLDTRKFEAFIVDVGFDVPATLSTEIVHGAGFLEFAGIESPRIPALAIEIHLAEKLHAYSKHYPNGRYSTRVKDLIDIILIGQSFSLDASACVAALRQTFESRDTQKIPDHFALPPEDWSVTYPVLARSVGMDPDISAGHAYAARLLDPLLSKELTETAVWDRRAGEWGEGST